MNAKTKKAKNSNGLMGQLLLLADSESKYDRRSEKRIPFFRPVSVQFDDRSYSAFTREIGASGMGLLHNLELPLEEVLIKFAGRAEQLCLRIEHCRSVGEGWYVSGGKVVDSDA